MRRKPDAHTYSVVDGWSQGGSRHLSEREREETMCQVWIVGGGGAASLDLTLKFEMSKLHG